MRKKNYKGAKCTKRTIPKCEGICKTYDSIQYAYADLLSAYTNRLVTFVERITDEMYEEDNGIYSDGVTLIDNVGEAEKDIAGMYCIMKDGRPYNLEDFYADFGAFSNARSFQKNIVNLIADR